MIRTRGVWILAVLGMVSAIAGPLQAQDGKERRKPEGCTHDFSKFREAMKLSEDQKAQLEKIREQINSETHGLNRCVIRFMMDELKGMEKDSDAFNQKKQEIEQKREAIKAAMQKFEDARKGLLTDEQKKTAEEMKAMMKEHREVCMKGKEGDRPDRKRRGGEGEGRGEGRDHEKDHPDCSLDKASQEGVFHHHEGRRHKEGHKEDQKN